MESNDVSNIVIDFPKDKVLGQVEEFYEGASGSFFRTFNAYGSAQVVLVHFIGNLGITELCCFIENLLVHQ